MALTIEMPDGSNYKEFDNGTALGISDNPDPVPTDNVRVAGFTPTPGQACAIEAGKALMRAPGRGLLVIRGFAGTGKTTMLRVFSELYGQPLVVTPTGKAALRVQQATGIPASTIHRWLYAPREDGRGQTKFELKKIDEVYVPSCKLVIIDEASMVGRDIWADLWRTAERLGLRVIAVGDGFQLPPVQDKGSLPFSLLDDTCIKSLGGTVVELTDVLRQALDSPVVRASMELRAGGGVQALATLPRIEPQTLLATAEATFKAGGVIISASNVARHRMNVALRAAMNRQGYLAPGEPLLVLRNNYDVDLYNGEQITFDAWHKAGDWEVLKDKYSGEEANVQFGLGQVGSHKVVLLPQEFDGGLPFGIGGFSRMVAAQNWARANRLYTDRGDVVPYLEANYGYCYTAHKSQGSEWPYALVLLEPSVKLGTEEGRRWAYTAITRAQQAAAIHYGKV